MKENVLIVSADVELAKQLEIFLTRHDCIAHKVEHDSDAFKALNDINISLVLYDLLYNNVKDFNFFDYVKKKHQAFQIIVLIDYDKIDLEMVLGLMKNGAYDFVTKPIDEERLLFSITNGLERKKDFELKYNAEKKAKDYQEILMKELEMTKKELEATKKELYSQNLELELIYGNENLENFKSIDDYFSKNVFEKSIKDQRIGKYTILEAIGKGGMSIVYKAVDHILNRQVAVKQLTLLKEDLPTYVIEDIRKRFKKEAQVIAMLDHENIVKVFDIILEDDKYYMIMEYIEGRTLENIIIQRKKLPIPEAISIIMDVCIALDYIHSNNIIHRDIKPSNILIENTGCIKLTDFGVIRDISESTVTPTGSIVGTIAYIAPEQGTKHTDFRVDIFSLGIILYELITGIHPFKANSYAQTFMNISNQTPKKPSEINSKCNEALDYIIMKTIEKNPDKRYTNSKSLYKDLVIFMESYEKLIV